jgi:hypothetical protein
MNRIGMVTSDNTIEYKRLQELLPYLDQMDIVLDIHSVPANDANNLMGICHTKDRFIAQEILETERLLIDDNFDTQ